MISWLLVSVALAASPPPPLSQGAALPACPLPPAPSASPSADSLADEARQALAVRDRARAEALLERMLRAEGSDARRAWALRMLADLRQGREDRNALRRILESDCIGGEARIHALAWLASLEGRHQDAVDLLRPLVRPRHHTLPRWSIVHEDLGDAYARLGRRADAQAQWRIALATDYDPGAGWHREALARKLAANLESPAGAEPMLPLQRYDDAISILDLASVERTEAGVAFSKLVLLQEDENGTAYGIDRWEVECGAPRARVLSVHSFDAEGTKVRSVDEPAGWARDVPGDPWRPTERALVCGLDADAPLAPRQKTNLEMLRAYRAGEPVFEQEPPRIAGDKSAAGA